MAVKIVHSNVVSNFFKITNLDSDIKNNREKNAFKNKDLKCFNCSIQSEV